MRLKEQFDNVEIMFEGQGLSLEYDELCEASIKCEKIAEDLAISFAEFLEGRDLYLENKTILEVFSEFKESLK